jgi:hypothetical protein
MIRAFRAIASPRRRRHLRRRHLAHHPRAVPTHAPLRRRCDGLFALAAQLAAGTC